MPQNSQYVQSVARALRILMAFADGHSEVSVGDLSQQLGLPKSTVSRLLQTLEQMHFVMRDQRTGFYRLGPAIFTLAARGLTPEHIRVVARPHLHALAEQFGETVNLSLHDGDAVVNTEQVIGTQRMIVRVGWIGRRMPLHAASSGKAVLAFLPSRQVEAYLSKPLERYTAQTLTDAVHLRRELAIIRQRHYAIAMNELE
ncbi:MAG: IclR family transcriptional regulator, partial [Ardenticatenia bacterium]